MQTFIVVITNKLNIGLTAIPYYAKIYADKPIKLIEQATIEHIKNATYNLQEDEIEIIKILSKINENALFKRYSKERRTTLKDFLNNLPTDERYDKAIYPYIQGFVYQAIITLSKTTIPIFYKEDNFSQIYQSEQLKIAQTPTVPHFYFNLENNILEYKFKLIQKSYNEEIELNLTESDPIIITNKPASFIQQNR
ncbi:MAG: hypothetical protein GX879_11815, partial [Bacteroidales bacterium]|nr:hypothetical protein [Bacteroidales bacterium]